jgi:invasion protein IalB
LARQCLLSLVVAASVSFEASAQQSAPAILSPEKAPEAELVPRGQRKVDTIKFSAWEKTCFRSPNAKLVCRTSANGTREAGQQVARIDLVEREGDPQARLQMLLPVGLYLQAGVKVTVDKGAGVRVPYNWCFSNICVAAAPVPADFVKQLESGQALSFEVVDAAILATKATLPLSNFRVIHQGPPAQTYDHGLDSK